MKTLAKFLPLGLLLAACGSMRETTQVRDDVYDIPDRTVMASVSSSSSSTDESTPAGNDADYYNAQDAQGSSTGAYRDYYDMTYNDPYYYNYGRFGFNSSMGMGGFGPSYGMGMSYGWPTGWGGMSIGYGMGYGMGMGMGGMGMGYGGYNPYWSNSWMSGYGMMYNPWDPFGYGYGGYGMGYGLGYGYGYGPYQGPYGGCYGCYEPVGYSNTIYAHRPSMTGSSGNTSTSQTSPRAMYRNPASLLQPMSTGTLQRSSSTGRQMAPAREGRQMNDSYTRPARNTGAERTRPARNWSFGGDDSPSRGGGISMPSRSGGGGGGGGGRVSSPRPR